MNNQDSLQYLTELSEALIGTEVTDGAGNTMSLQNGMDKALELIEALRVESNKIMLIGNGGSSAIVSHVHNDLCKAVGVRAMVFNDTPLLTALSNDESYDRIFEYPVILWASPGDILFAVSSSGKSENILRAVRKAVETKCTVVTFTGFQSDNPLRHMGDLNFYVSANSYGHVEVAHMALAHLLTDFSQN